MGRTQTERKAETRARLIDAAADLFARRGFHAVSADAVADAADRTTGALYSHFGGKDGVLLAVLEAKKRATMEEIGAELDAAPDVDARLEALWRRFAGDTGDRGGDAWLLLEHELWLYAARNTDVAGDVAARYASDRVHLALGLDRWQEDEGVDPTLPSTQQATLALGLLLGLAMQHRVDPDAVPAELVVRGLRRVLAMHEDGDRSSPPPTPRPTGSRQQGHDHAHRPL